MPSERGASVGVTIIYTSDRLGQDEAEDELLDFVSKHVPEHRPDFTVMKIFVFEAGEEGLVMLLRNWWLRRRKVRPEVRPRLFGRRGGR